MADRNDILTHLDELLRSSEFADYGPNGLQVPGAREVTRVLTCVSATLAAFEYAAETGAQMVLAHHGIFWGGPQQVSEAQAARLKALLVNDISLAAYHLPLDAHGEVGNNALLCRELGLEPERPFASHRGNTIGWIGRAPEPLSADDLRQRVRTLLDRDPLFFVHGPEQIERVGIVSGGGSGNLADAIDAGVDAFITGEPAERVMAESLEAGIHFLAAGHYATETLGIRRIGEIVAERFGVEHEFLDLPNPI